MSDAQKQDMADELAYVRSLAEEGRSAPLVGGHLYVLWGALTSVAALVSWLDEIDVAPFDGRMIGWTPWIAAGVIGWALSFFLGGRTRRKPGSLTVGNKTAHAAWLGVGLFMTLLFAALTFAHDNYTSFGVPRYFLFSMMFPIAFGLYGVAFLATASAAKVAWFRYVTAASWFFSILSLFMLTSEHQMLVAGLGTLVCAVAPGIVLMRREPSEIV